MIENTDKELIKLNNSLRSKLKKQYQPTVTTLFTEDQFLEVLNSNADRDFKKSVITDMGRKVFKIYDYNGVTYNQTRSQVIFLVS